MKKSEMMIGLGLPAGDGAEDDEMAEGSEPESSESSEDEDIDTALDPKEDMGVRREAFRRVIEACVKRQMGGGYSKE